MISSDPPPNSSAPSSLGLRSVVHADQPATAPSVAKARRAHRTAAQCLKESREKLGWTIGRAATNYGVTAASWSAWEKGSKADGDAVAWILDIARDFVASKGAA